MKLKSRFYDKLFNTKKNFFLFKIILCDAAGCICFHKKMLLFHLFYFFPYNVIEKENSFLLKHEQKRQENCSFSVLSIPVFPASSHHFGRDFSDNIETFQHPNLSLSFFLLEGRILCFLYQRKNQQQQY